jgi:hypothetical protein
MRTNNVKITYVVTCAIEAVHREENGVTSFGEIIDPVKVFESEDLAKAHQFLEGIQNFDNDMIHDADGIAFITTEGLCSHCHHKLKMNHDSKPPPPNLSMFLKWCAENGNRYER